MGRVLPMTAAGQRQTQVHNCICPFCGNRWTMETNLDLSPVTEWMDGYEIVWKVMGCLANKDGFLVNVHQQSDVQYAYHEFLQGRGPIWGKKLEIVRA